MTVQEIGDRLEIGQLLYRYARAIDTRELDLLDGVFTPDAEIHYAVGGGVRLPYREMKPWLAQVLPMHRVTQHAMSNPLVEVDGDRARATTYLTAAHVQETQDGALHYVVQHGVYSDELTRTPAGWRISRRRLDALHTDGRFRRADEVVRYPKPAPTG
jgi:3-phenylpropionate/cinnamic acid dioxygenase small subunit